MSLLATSQQCVACISSGQILNTNDGQPPSSPVLKVEFNSHHIIDSYMLVPGGNLLIRYPHVDHLLESKTIQVPLKTTPYLFKMLSAMVLDSMGVLSTKDQIVIPHIILLKVKRLLSTYSGGLGGASVSIEVDLMRIQHRQFEYDEEEAERLMSAMVARIMMESMEEQRTTPASPASIERSMEKVVIDDVRDVDNSSTQVCTICREDFEMGIEVAKMPCSHVYHQDCIKQWLLISGVCPLCRYKLDDD